MATFSVLVEVSLRNGIADPQGQTIERALPALGFDAADDVRVGKRIELTVEAEGSDEAERLVNEMCERLLANPVIETYRVAIRS